MKIKKWIPLFFTQFLGLLNDNLLKNLIILISAWWLAKDGQATVIAIASALLVLPYILFSPLAGKWASTKSKLSILRWAKLLEIPIMLVALAGFAFQSIPLVMTALFLMGLQSTIYSPSKLGLIRDIGGIKGISFGTGTMELLAFIGVIASAAIAGIVADMANQQLLFIGGITLFLATTGLWSSMRIKAKEETPEQQYSDSVNPVKFMLTSMSSAKKIKGLLWAIFGLGGFWLIGSLLHMNLFVHTQEVYHMSNTETGLVMTFVALGIGIGCLTAGLIAKNRVEIGIVPIGGLGLSIALTVLAFADLSTPAFITTLMLGAFFSGWFKVPLTAWIQERVEGRKLGQVLAFSNMVVFLFILLSSGLFAILSSTANSFSLFALTATIAWVCTAIALVRLPAAFTRFIVFGLIRLLFKIKVLNEDRIPRKSGALIVANHVSYLDALIIVATVPRMIRFVMLKDVYDNKRMNWFFRKLNMIPISARKGGNDLEQFNKTCQREINKGHIVCIFAEGTVSRTGNLLEFKKGMEHISKGITAPIIPIHLDGVIGIPFTFKAGRKNMVRPTATSIRRKITVNIGEHLPNTSTAFEVRQTVHELGAESFHFRIRKNETLGAQFIRITRMNKKQTFAEDESGFSITNKKALNLALQLALQFKKSAKKEERVAIYQPHSVLNLITNVALTLSGKEVVNLNDQLKTEQLKEVIETQQIQTLITTRQWYFQQKKLNVKRVIFIEEMINNTSMLVQLRAFLLRPMFTNTIIKRLSKKADKQTVAAITTKVNGNSIQYATHTHENVIAAIKGLRQVHHLNRKESILGLLPFATAHGYLLNLWTPICSGCTLMLHHYSDETEQIAQTIVAGNTTVFIGHSNIIERLNKLDSTNIWEKLKHVITGNSRVAATVKEQLEQNFGLTVRNSFSTMYSPVITVNTPDYIGKDIAGGTLSQSGTIKQSAGRPLPGIAVKVVDPNNYNKTLSENEVGMILITGAHVIKDCIEHCIEYCNGWMVTDQLGSVDPKGFVNLSH
jgi:acyl-[acyl-carrier-protein]-phospholipid O-acyltransferase/long-chain-fatty-acid--[acyl-carrier-protein] ligase